MDNLLELKPDAEEQKDKLIEQYRSEFNPNDTFIIANMLGAITGED